MDMACHTGGRQMERYTDTLTGLPDRATFNQALIQVVGPEESVALVVLDIDRFMAINDTYGNKAGDQILQCLAALLRDEAGGQAYRISGDEFAVLLPGVSLEQSFLRMEGLRRRVQEARERFGLPDQREV